jgi:hypothetical protein
MMIHRRTFRRVTMVLAGTLVEELLRVFAAINDRADLFRKRDDIKTESKLALIS